MCEVSHGFGLLDEHVIQELRELKDAVAQISQDMTSYLSDRHQASPQPPLRNLDIYGRMRLLFRTLWKFWT